MRKFWALNSILVTNVVTIVNNYMGREDPIVSSQRLWNLEKYTFSFNFVIVV